VYAKGALLQAVASTGSATVSIQNITYNPKGQREDIYYGNATKTRYYYNPLNFRITRILTTRNSGQDVLQDGNIPKCVYFLFLLISAKLYILF
jgi:hypothetical protein